MLGVPVAALASEAIVELDVQRPRARPRARASNVGVEDEGGGACRAGAQAGRQAVILQDGVLVLKWFSKTV